MSVEHDNACRLVDVINQRINALSRGLLIALDTLTLLETEDDAEQRELIHLQARNDIHSLIAEVM